MFCKSLTVLILSASNQNSVYNMCIYEIVKAILDNTYLKIIHV